MISRRCFGKASVSTVKSIEGGSDSTVTRRSISLDEASGLSPVPVRGAVHKRKLRECLIARDGRPLEVVRIERRIRWTWETPSSGLRIPRPPKWGRGSPADRACSDGFRDQMKAAGPGPYLFPSEKNGSGHQTTFTTVWQKPEVRQNSVFSDLRSPLNLRNSAQRRGRCGRVGHPNTSARRRESLQEVLADKVAHEGQGFGKDQPAR